MTNVFSPQGPNSATTLPAGSNVQRYGRGVETYVKNASVPGRGDGTILDAAFFNRIITNLNHVVDKSGVNAAPGDQSALYRAILEITSGSKISFGRGLTLKDGKVSFAAGNGTLTNIDAVDPLRDRLTIYDASSGAVEETSAFSIVDSVISGSGLIQAARNRLNGSVTITFDSEAFLAQEFPKTLFHNVMDNGAVPDFGSGNTDNTIAFQKTIDLARASGGTVFVPAGKYYFAQGSASLDPGDGGFSMVGEYGSSELRFHEGTDAVEKRLIRNVANVDTKKHLYFHGITFVGTWGISNFVRRGGPAAFLDHYPELKFSYVKFLNLSQMATDLHFNEFVSFDHCTFQDVNRDGARMRESKYGSVTNCVFRRIGDDNIAWHGGKYVAGYDPDDGSPRREGLFVIGNTFVDTTSCISALGARNVTIQANYADRIGGHGFCYIINHTEEGTHPLGHIDISHNRIFNQYHEDACIYIGDVFTPRGTAESGNVVPGQPAADGSFEFTWNYQNADLNNAADAFPPAENITICNNIIARTLPAVAHYSDWGFGQTVGLYDSAFAADPAITDAMLRPPAGINCVTAKAMMIKNNIINHTDSPIFIVHQENVSPAINGAQISGNVMFDYTGSAITLAYTDGEYVDLQIDGNSINGDPYRAHTQSNADGTYDSGFGFPRAFSLGTSYGATISNNRVSNVAYVIENPTRHYLSNNTLVADLVAIGDNAGNKGIRNAPPVEAGFDYVIADCDPTSANYGLIKNVMVKYASAMPATGMYAKGWVVTNSAQTIAGTTGARYIITGWKRLTSGSAHVLGTDWFELRSALSETDATQWLLTNSGGILNTPGGVSLVKFGDLPSAVNCLQFYNAPSGGAPQIQAVGEANVGMEFRVKGAANGYLSTGGSGNQVRWSAAGVGFNGNSPVGKQTLSAALSTGGAETNANLASAINAMRALLVSNGLGV